MQKYSIVEFIEENTVEIILSSWILPNNKTALWPKNITPSILKRHLKNSTVPSDDWSSVNIRVLGHTDSLADATKKAYKAQETSHLSSESDFETYCTSKRQKKLPLRYQSSSSDDENLAPGKKHLDSEKRTKRPVVPSFPEFQDSEITETDQLKKKLQRNAQATSSSIICNENAKIQSEEINAEKSKNIQYVKERVLTKIFKLIEEIRFETIATRKKQQEIKIKLDTLLTQNDNSTINKFSRLLPISSMESFDEIDQCLTNSEEDLYLW